MMTYNQDTLFSKISTEGYCCMRGYLMLCRSRGEAVRDMAAFIGMHRYTLYYHIRKLNAGEYPCQKITNCMMPIIEELQKEKK